LVAEAAHSDANIIFGAVIDDTLGDEVRVTVIAAGFDAGPLPYKKVDVRREPTRPPVAPPPVEAPVTFTPLPRSAAFSETTMIRTPFPAASLSLDDELDIPDFLKN
jgi:cell division protein FtsZ